MIQIPARSALVLLLPALILVASPGTAQTSAEASPNETVSDQIDELTKMARAAKEAAERADVHARKSLQRATELAREARRNSVRSAAERDAALKEMEEAREQSRLDADAARAEAGRAAAASRLLAQAKEENVRALTQARRVTLYTIAGAVVAIAALLVVVGVFWRRLKAGRRKPGVSNCALSSNRINLQLSGQLLPDEMGGVIVGRNPAEASAVINDNYVSKRHARFFHRDGKYWVEDLGSLHGTVVDGVELEGNGSAVAIEPGARVRVADVEFTFSVNA